MAGPDTATTVRPMMASVLWKMFPVFLLACIGTASGGKTYNGCESLSSFVVYADETAADDSTLLTLNSATCFRVVNSDKLFTTAKIGENTWDLKLVSTLDLETNNKLAYNLNVQCCTAGKPKALEYNGQVLVNPINEFPPSFTKSTDSIIVKESQPIDEVVYDMKTKNPATDPDVGGTVFIQYNIEEGSNGMFAIKDRLEGSVVVKKSLDFETKKLYTLKISAQESELRYHKVFTTLTINIEDVDDNNPKFAEPKYSLEIDEGAYKTRTCFPTTPPIKATDGDMKINAIIIYDLAEENEPIKSLFSMESNGNLCVSGTIRRGTYFVNIKAMQQDNPTFRLALAVVDVTVLDVNDHAPIMGESNYKADVSEEAVVGSIVLVMSATDEDEGENAQFAFELTGKGSEKFGIDRVNNQAILKLASKLDREAMDNYNLEVYAQETKTSDKKKSQTSIITVHVLDENDNAPVFEPKPTNKVDILENSPKGKLLTQVTAQDADSEAAGTVTYSLQPSPNSNLFIIDPDTGRITLHCSTCLDYSKTKDITLIVQAKDNGEPPRSSLTSIIVTVVETQFAPPTFTQPAYNVSVPENEAAGFLIQVQAKDSDTSDSQLKYSLTTPSDTWTQSVIQVDNNGRVKSLDSFDAETNSSFTFGVTVTDGHSQDHTFVHVTVTDVNEYDPFIDVTSPIEIPENIAKGTTVTQFQLDDEDQSKEGFTAWLGEGSDGKFHLDPDSNTIVTTSILDRWVKPKYKMTIHAMDNGHPPRSSAKEIEVILTDSNTAPVFVDGDNATTVTNYEFSVHENASIGFKVGSLHVFDPDKGSSGRLIFRIDSITPADDFELDSDSASRETEIKVKKSLDFETHSVYKLVVNVTDESFQPKHVTTEVTIGVLDVPERPIWPSKRLRVYLTQSDVCADSDDVDADSSREVTVLVAQSNEKIEYGLVNMTNEFSLNKTSGLLVNKMKLEPGKYVLSVKACSGKVCSPAYVTVVVQSDSVLTFCQGFYMRSISESRPINTELIRFSVNKQVKGVQYSIASGDLDKNFVLRTDGTEGILEIAKLLDRELVSRYEIVVMATAGGEEARAQVIIEILDEPDTPPTFPVTEYTGRVQENTASDVVPVLTVKAEDKDSNPQITYSLPDDLDQTVSVDVGGHIYVNKTLDYEKMDGKWNHALTFDVVASDKTFTAVTKVIITVTDTNDEYPMFKDVVRSTSVLENVSVPFDLIKMTATDDDNDDRIIYSMSMLEPKDLPTPFSIHPLTGQLEVRHPLDRESTDKYTLQITAEDLVNHKATTNLVVEVEDVNDNHPICGQAGYSMNVTEGQKGVSTTLTINVTDADHGDSSDMTLRITSGNNKGYFQIQEDGTQFVLSTVKAIPWTVDLSEITLEITASDAGSPRRACDVTVFVQDTNDHSPEFKDDLYTATVPEGSPNDTPLSMTPPLDVTDADGRKFGKDGVVYSIMEKDLPFRINLTSGQVYVTMPTGTEALDRETTPVYNLTVVATDEDGKGLSSNTIVRIDVTDVDDTAPVFHNEFYTFTVPEDAKFGTSVGRVSADDVDTSNDVIFYTMDNGHFLPFALDYKSGDLSVVGKLDADSQNTYNLSVSASDRLQTTVVRVIVMVTKVYDDDWCPFNITKPISLTVSEHQSVYEAFDEVAASGYGNTSYVVDDPELKEFFHVNSSGKIILLKPVISLQSPISFDVLGIPEVDSDVTCTAHVTVIVERENDFAPEFCQIVCPVTTFKFLTTEDSPVDSILGQIQSRDNDKGPDGEVTYHIRATPLSGFFSIDQNGILTLNSTIDISQFENPESVSFEVTAADGGTPPKSSTATVEVQVLQDSDALLKFDNNTYFMNVDEELENGTSVGNLSVSSKHIVTFTLSGYDLPFHINENTGELTTTEKLDLETKPSYQFVVIATDVSQPKYSAATQVTVTLNDVNDNTPEFKPHQHPPVLVDEGKTKEKLVRVMAVDFDQGKYGTVFYSLVADDPHFSVDPTSGWVSLIQPLDRELTPTTSLVIQASDFGQPPRTSNTTLSINIRDVNDHAPTFTSSTFTKNIALENNTDYTLQPVIIMNATDLDEGENGNVFYSLQQDGHRPVFQIRPFTGQIFSIFPDLTLGTYNLTVAATDFGDPPLHTTTLVTVVVAYSHARSPPVLTLAPSEITLFVGMRQELDLGVTIDADNAQNVFLQDTHDKLFKLTPTDHKLILGKPLTHSTVYTLEVTAVNTEGINVTEVLTVHVLPLEFDQPIYTSRIPEDHSVPFTFLDLNSVAERQSIDPVRYSLQNHTDFFKVTPDGGNVTLTRALDREKVNIVTLTVAMKLVRDHTDQTRRSHSALATITVYVTDVNDHAPSFAFPGSTLVISLPVGVGPGYVITVLKAFDPDEGDNKAIVYRIVMGGDSIVSLNTTTGVLSLVDDAALRSMGSLTLLVEACDPHVPLLCDNITVEVILPHDDFRLVIPLSHSVFQDNQETIMKRLSAILGYRLDLPTSRVNVNDGVVDTSRTDIFFRAYTLTTNETVPTKTLSSQVSKNQKKITDSFKEFLSVKKASVQDFSNTAVIALLTVAGGMFLASFVAVFIVCRLYRKQKEEEKKVASAQRARHNAGMTGKGSGANSDPDEPLELSENGRSNGPSPSITIARQEETTFMTTDENKDREESTIAGGKGKERVVNGGVAGKDNGHVNVAEKDTDGADQVKTEEGSRGRGYDNPALVGPDKNEEGAESHLFENIPLAGQVRTEENVDNNGDKQKTTTTPVTKDDKQKTTSTTPVTEDDKQKTTSTIPVTKDDKQETTPTTLATKDDKQKTSPSTPMTKDDKEIKTPTTDMTKDDQQRTISTTPMTEDHKQTTASKTPVTPTSLARIDDKQTTTQTTSATQDYKQKATPTALVTKDDKQKTTPTTSATQDDKQKATPTALVTKEDKQKTTPTTSATKDDKQKATPTALVTKEDKQKTTPTTSATKDDKQKATPTALVTKDDKQKTTPTTSATQDDKQKATPTALVTKEDKQKTTPTTSATKDDKQKATPTALVTKEDKQKTTPTTSATKDDKQKATPTALVTKDDKQKTTSTTSATKDDKQKATPTALVTKEDKQKTTPTTSATKDDKQKATPTALVTKDDKQKTTSTTSATKDDKQKATPTALVTKEDKQKTTPTTSATKDDKQKATPTALVTKDDKQKTTSTTSATKDDKQKATPTALVTKEDKQKTTPTTSATKDDKQKATPTALVTKEDKQKTTPTTSATKDDKQKATPTALVTKEDKQKTTPTTSATKDDKQKATPTALVTKDDKQKTTSTTSATKDDKQKATPTALVTKDDKQKTTPTTSATNDGKQKTASTALVTKDDKQKTTLTPPSTKDDKQIKTPTAPVAKDVKQMTTPTIPAKKDDKQKLTSTAPVTKDDKQKTTLTIPATKENKQKTTPTPPATKDDEQKTTPTTLVTKDDKQKAASTIPATKDDKQKKAPAIPASKYDEPTSTAKASTKVDSVDVDIDDDEEEMTYL